MFLRVYSPCLALRSFVREYTVMHVEIEREKGIISKPFPASPDQCLYFYARDPVISRKGGETSLLTNAPSIIVGPQVTRVNLELHPNHLTVAVVFRPGGLHALLGQLPMTELFDCSIDSSLIWPTEIRELNEQLAATSNYDLMVALVEGFLVRQYARQTLSQLPFDKIIHTMVQSPQVYSIDKLADMACLSGRQFRRKFYEKMGLSPKTFARIVRFSKAFRLKEKNPKLDWLDVVTITGYHDFRHLVRDFKDFADATPALLSEEESRHQLKIYTTLD